MAASARPWAACATSWVNPTVRPRASASASATRWRRCTPAWARSPPCTIANAAARGQVVDAAIYESVLNMMESLVTEYDQLGHVRERSGPILPRIAPSNVYPTRDGIVMIGANQDTVFARLCEAMETPQLASDERYRDHQARGANQRELDEIIARWTATLGTRELLALLEKARRALGTHLPRGRHARGSALRRARRPSSRTPHPQFGTAAHAERRAAPVGDARLHPHAGAGTRAAQRRGLSASCSASAPNARGALRSQRRDLTPESKKAGRLAPGLSMHCRLAGWRLRC